jgi:hypothetical protein
MLILSVKRLWLFVALFAVVTATGTGIAWQLAQPDRPGAPVALIAQGEDEVCPPGERECRIEDEQEQTGPGQPGNEGGGGGGGGCTWTGGGPVLASLAAQTTIQIPCYLDLYGWYGGDSCYYGDPPLLVDAPAPPQGKTDADGRWYWASCFFDIFQFNGEWILNGFADIRWQWFDFDDIPTVSPEELAMRAIASVGLDGVAYRLAPPETGAGLVGLPVWLGVAGSPNAWGPVTGGPECDGGLCVSITAQVTSVQWNMGDGTVLTCQRNQHVAWQRGMDFLAPRDNCHHYYHQASRRLADGRYQISATSNWLVEWESTSGLTGSISTTRASATSLQINEIQVLTGP